MRLVLLTALTMVAFAANSILNRMALADGEIGPVLFAVLRVAAGAAMLALIATRRGGADWLKTARPGAAAALSLYMLGFSLAYLALDAGTGALILFGGVQLTMFAAAMAAREPIPPRRWVGTAVALIGLVLLVGWPRSAGSAWAAASMAAAALGWGIYSLIGRGARDPIGATAANFTLSLPVVALALLAAVPEPPAARGVVLALVSGAVTSGLGYALWYAVLPSLQRTAAALAQLTVPLIAAAGGVLFLGEAPTPRLLAAAALITGGVVAGMDLRLLRRRGGHGR